MPVSRVNFSFLDKQSKIGDVGFWLTLLSAGNFTAENGLIDALSSAVQAVTLLNLKQDERLASVSKFSVSAPTEDFALKGIKWLVRMTDTNGNAVSVHIPGADLSLSTDGKTLDVAAGPGADLKDAIEAVVRSNDGEAVIVQEVIYLDK